VTEDVAWFVTVKDSGGGVPSGEVNIDSSGDISTGERDNGASARVVEHLPERTVTVLVIEASSRFPTRGVARSTYWPSGNCLAGHHKARLVPGKIVRS
jgi:hypothetical protein